MRFCDKFKTYLHQYNGYGHQTCQGDNLPPGVPTHKATEPFNHVVLWDHLENQEHLSRLPQCHKVTWPFKKWLCEVMWQIKNIKSQLSQCLWSTTCQGGEILPGAPTHKFTGPFNYKVLWLFFLSLSVIQKCTCKSLFHWIHWQIYGIYGTYGIRFSQKNPSIANIQWSPSFKTIINTTTFDTENLITEFYWKI